MLAKATHCWEAQHQAELSMASACESPISSPICFCLSPAATAQYTVSYILPSIMSIKKMWAPWSSNKQNHSLWEYTDTQVGLASSVCSWISSSTKLGVPQRPPLRLELGIMSTFNTQSTAFILYSLLALVLGICAM